MMMVKMARGGDDDVSDKNAIIDNCDGDEDGPS